MRNFLINVAIRSACFVVMNKNYIFLYLLEEQEFLQDTMYGKNKIFYKICYFSKSEFRLLKEILYFKMI